MFNEVNNNIFDIVNKNNSMPDTVFIKLYLINILFATTCTR